jgi:hypothetical protein
MTFIRLSLLILLFFAGNFAYAQTHHLTGRVTDSASNLPLNGVTVLLKPGNKTAITDETGRFFYKTVPSGTHVCSRLPGRKH